MREDSGLDTFLECIQRFAIVAGLFLGGLPLQNTYALEQLPIDFPVYDVATFRQNVTGSSDFSVNSNIDSTRATNWPLEGMLEDAFTVQKDLLFGLPDWVKSVHYDVDAKISSPNVAQLKALPQGAWSRMLRVLLEERFALKWHYEMKTVSVYELMQAKSGPKLTPTTARPGHAGTSMHNYDLTATAIPVRHLAEILAQQVERPVVDKTGLSGSYDFHLRWTPDRALNGHNRSSDSDTAPALFTALQEQLGLRLKTGKDPVQVVVIDSISPPSDN